MLRAHIEAQGIVLPILPEARRALALKFDNNYVTLPNRGMSRISTREYLEGAEAAFATH